MTLRVVFICHQEGGTLLKDFKVPDKFLVLVSVAFSLLFFKPETSNAMHIMEGFLPINHAIFWGLLSLPFLVFGFIKITKIIKKDSKNTLLVAMLGAFTFVLSALKIPSLTGSSSHPTGTGLGAVLIGPAPLTIIGALTLLFQALLLAHGGITTLGANIFSMAIVGPYVAFTAFSIMRKLRAGEKISIFTAALLGNLLTYVVTSIQLALAHPSEIGGFTASLIKFLSIFALTQIPLSVIEGLLSVVVFIGLKSYALPELKSIGFIKEGDNEAV